MEVMCSGCLRAFHISLCRASELVAYSNCKIHKDFGFIRGGGVVFKKGGVQLHKHPGRQAADRVELRLKAHKGDQKGWGVFFLGIVFYHNPTSNLQILSKLWHTGWRARSNARLNVGIPRLTRQCPAGDIHIIVNVVSMHA